MNPQVNAITLGVSDLARAKQFYGEGLGCPVKQDHEAFVSFDLGDGSSVLALYTRDALAYDAGVPADGSGFTGITLSYFADSNERVDEVLAQAEKAGGKILKLGEAAQWGGYSGYFSDPDGYLWKVVATG